MGGLSSREASNSIHTLRYGNHEIGLVPVTRANFSSEYPDLRQQFIRVRNDPNVRYSHMRADGYSLMEVPPESYTEADLERLLDTVEAGLYPSNLSLLEDGMPPLQPTPLHHFQQFVSEYQSTADLEASKAVPRVESAAPATYVPVEQLGRWSTSSPSLDSRSQPIKGRSDFSFNNSDDDDATGSTGISTDFNIHGSPFGGSDIISRLVKVKSCQSTGTFAAADSDLPKKAENESDSGPGDESPSFHSSRCFEELTRALQELSASLAASAPDASARAPSRDFFNSPIFRRFKQSLRPVPCAILFIYANWRDDGNCFVFRGRNVNVIGSFDFRSYEDPCDDAVPYLQVQKAILKAAGDRTLERVVTLAAKYYLECFTQAVSEVLEKYPHSPVFDIARSTTAVALTRGAALPDAAEVARLLLIDRLSNIPLVVKSLWNNYPSLKFIYDIAALIHCSEDCYTVQPEDILLSTYEKPKGERGIVFMFNGGLLAASWLWVAGKLRQTTVRGLWTQHMLEEQVQERERLVQHWLSTDPKASHFLCGPTSTALLARHLDELHSEIVRARSTPLDDVVSWSPTQLPSHDGKIYRIFLSPICGPFLTTVKTAVTEQRKTKRKDGGRSAAAAASLVLNESGERDGNSLSSNGKRGIHPMGLGHALLQHHHHHSGSNNSTLQLSQNAAKSYPGTNKNAAMSITTTPPNSDASLPPPPYLQATTNAPTTTATPPCLYTTVQVPQMVQQDFSPPSQSQSYMVAYNSYGIPTLMSLPMANNTPPAPTIAPPPPPAPTAAPPTAAMYSPVGNANAMQAGPQVYYTLPGLPPPATNNAAAAPPNAPPPQQQPHGNGNFFFTTSPSSYTTVSVVPPNPPAGFMGNTALQPLMMAQPTGGPMLLPAGYRVYSVPPSVAAPSGTTATAASGPAVGAAALPPHLYGGLERGVDGLPPPSGTSLHSQWVAGIEKSYHGSVGMPTASSAVSSLGTPPQVMVNGAPMGRSNITILNSATDLSATMGIWDK